MTLNVETTSLSLNTRTKVIVTDDSNPDSILVSFAITVEGVTSYHPFPFVKNPMLGPTSWQVIVEGFELGNFESQSVPIKVYSTIGTTASIYQQSVTMECLTSTDPYELVVSYYLDVLKANPTIAGMVKVFNRIKDNISYMSEVPAVYIYVSDSEMIPNIGKSTHEFTYTLVIEFLEDIRGRRQIDNVKHRQFAQIVAEYVAAHPQGSYGEHLKIVNSFVKKITFPWSAMVSSFLILTSIEIEVRVYPYDTGDV